MDNGHIDKLKSLSLWKSTQYHPHSFRKFAFKSQSIRRPSNEPDGEKSENSIAPSRPKFNLPAFRKSHTKLFNCKMAISWLISRCSFGRWTSSSQRSRSSGGHFCLRGARFSILNRRRADNTHFCIPTKSRIPVKQRRIEMEKIYKRMQTYSTFLLLSDDGGGVKPFPSSANQTIHEQKYQKKVRIKSSQPGRHCRSRHGSSRPLLLFLHSLKSAIPLATRTQYSFSFMDSETRISQLTRCSTEAG